MKRRGWGMLIVILVGGWLLNVASGWVCERVADLRGQPPRLRPEDPDPTRPPLIGEVAWWQRYALSDWPKQPVRATPTHTIGVRRLLLYYEGTLDPGFTNDPYWVQRRRAGWPLLSMEGAVWTDPIRRTRRNDAILNLKNWRRFFLLRPVWPGTIVNTIFYALILLGSYQILHVMRRRRRIRRGKCPDCGYDLRGGEHTACPECGTPPVMPAKAGIQS